MKKGSKLNRVNYKRSILGRKRTLEGELDLNPMFKKMNRLRNCI